MRETSTSPEPATLQTRLRQVDGHARDVSGAVVAPQLDLADVHARADVDAERARSLADRLGALHGSRGPVEGGEDAVARALDQAAAVAVHLALRQIVVLIEESLPTPVAQLRQLPGRVDDVGEEDCGEHPVVRARRARAGEELLDLVGDRVGVLRVIEVVGALELHHPRSRNALGHVARVHDRDHPLVGSVQDQRRRVHERQRRPHVDVRQGSQELHRSPRARR